MGRDTLAASTAYLGHAHGQRELELVVLRVGRLVLGHGRRRALVVGLRHAFWFRWWGCAACARRAPIALGLVWDLGGGTRERRVPRDNNRDCVRERAAMQMGLAWGGVEARTRSRS